MSEIIDKAKALMDTYEQLLAQTRAERTVLAAIRAAGGAR